MAHNSIFDQKEWERCVSFHGHSCGGLMIGYKAALYAMELLRISFSDNEEVACISENDACGVDAIQVMLGCSVGKGNLLFHMTGKQAFSFYNRKTGESVRLILKPRPAGLKKGGSLGYYKDCMLSDMFDKMDTRIELPETARSFVSYACDCCGEITGSNWIRLEGEKKLCLDCYRSYDRFLV